MRYMVALKSVSSIRKCQFSLGTYTHKVFVLHLNNILPAHLWGPGDKPMSLDRSSLINHIGLIIPACSDILFHLSEVTTPQ